MQLPEPSAEGWEAEHREIDAARQRAAKHIFTQGGVSAVLALARLTDSAAYIGQALFDSGLPENKLDTLIEAAVRSDDARQRDVASGLIGPIFREQKEPWAEALISLAIAENWGNKAVLAILCALPAERWTWNQVAKIGGEVETTYWRQASVLWISTDNEDVDHAIRMLIRVGTRQTCPVTGQPKQENSSTHGIAGRGTTRGRPPALRERRRHQ